MSVLHTVARMPEPGPPFENLLARLFVGQHGVRAGWRAALFLLAMAAQLFLIAMILRVVLHAHGAARGARRAHAAPVGAERAWPVAAGLRRQRADGLSREYQADGIWAEGSKKTRPPSAPGLPWGLVALAALMLGLSAGGFATGQGGGLSLAGDIGYALEWLCVSLLIGVTEEFAFRGYLLTALSAALGFWGAAVPHQPGLRRAARHQSRRNAAGPAQHGRGGAAVLPVHPLHRLALVRDRLSWRLGLRGKFPVRHRR